jgi:hypothetical protein
MEIVRKKAGCLSHQAVDRQCTVVSPVVGGLSPGAREVAVILLLSAMPPGANAYVFASRYGGIRELAVAADIAPCTLHPVESGGVIYVSQRSATGTCSAPYGIGSVGPSIFASRPHVL